MKKKYITEHEKSQGECSDCIFSQLCEEESNISLCKHYTDNDFYIDIDVSKYDEYHWNELSYHRYNEGLLDWNYDEYSCGNWMWM
jgi:hypothetical protein